MRLRHDWRFVLRRAWSVRLAFVSVLLSGLETCVQAALSLGYSFGAPAGLFAAFAGMVGMAALIARLVFQKDFA